MAKISPVRVTVERIYIVEHRKTEKSKWVKRRYLFTNRRDARHEADVCRNALGYYATRLRVWHPVAYEGIDR